MIMTAAAVNTEKQLSLFDSILVDRMEEKALEENPKAWRKLQKKLNKLEIPAPWAIRQSWSEPLLHGKTFRIDNPSGISLEEFIGGEGHFGHSEWSVQTITFEIAQNQLMITYQQKKKDGKGSLTQTLNIGLDGKYRKSVLSDGTYYAAGKWVLANELELEIRYQEALAAAIIRLTFDETTLRLSVRSQMPEELDITKRKVRTLQGSL